MPTIFIGGSRHISRLPPALSLRLDNIVAAGHGVVVGDADGADTAVQNHFSGHRYDRLTVFCAGTVPRNNLGRWPTRRVAVAEGVRGFAFHAAKDREMAEIADFGLMIWDDASPGTILNVLRLVAGGRPCVLSDLARRETATIRSVERWREVFDRCAPAVRAAIRARDDGRVVDRRCGVGRRASVNPQTRPSVFPALRRRALPHPCVPGATLPRGRGRRFAS